MYAAIGAIQGMIQRAERVPGDKISQIETPMKSKMSHIEGAIEEKRSKYTTPYDRYTSRHRSIHAYDYNDVDYN